MADAVHGSSQLLLNASVLVFLLRTMRGASAAARREEVSNQLLSLLRDFVDFESGTILLSRTPEELSA